MKKEELERKRAERNAAIMREFEAGRSRDWLCAKHDLSMAMIGRILISMGGERRAESRPSARKTRNAERDRRVVEAFKSGVTRGQLAERFELCTSAISVILIAGGVSPQERRKKPQGDPRMDKKRRVSDAVGRLSDDGRSVSEIAAALNVNLATVYRSLIELGKKPAETGPKTARKSLLDKRDAEMARMIKAGLSLQETAKRMGVGLAAAERAALRQAMVDQEKLSLLDEESESFGESQAAKMARGEAAFNAVQAFMFKSRKPPEA